MTFIIIDITGWAKIIAQFAAWPRTLTQSPVTNPMAFFMISKSRGLILASEWLALAQTDSLAVKNAFCFEWHNSTRRDGSCRAVGIPYLLISAICVLRQYRWQ